MINAQRVFYLLRYVQDVTNIHAGKCGRRPGTHHHGKLSSLLAGESSDPFSRPMHSETANDCRSDPLLPCAKEVRTHTHTHTHRPTPTTKQQPEAHCFAQKYWQDAPIRRKTLMTDGGSSFPSDLFRGPRESSVARGGPSTRNPFKIGSTCRYFAWVQGSGHFGVQDPRLRA